MMAKLYWATPAPHWIDSFDRLHAAWLLAILVVLCGCQFHPAPAPNVRVDVSQTAPHPETARPAQPLTAPEPRQAPPSDNSGDRVKAEPVVIPPTAGEQTAPEHPPIAFAEPGSGFSLSHLPAWLGGRRDEPQVATREVEPLTPLPGDPRQSDDSPALGNGGTDIAALPPAAPAADWHSLDTGPAIRRLPSPSIGDELPAGDNDAADVAATPAEKKPHHGFPWFTLVALAGVAGTVIFMHSRKGTHGPESAPEKTSPVPPTAEPQPVDVASADVDPVGVASGPGAG